TYKVKVLCSSLLLDARPTTYRALEGWLTTLPLGGDLIKLRRTFDTKAGADCFPFATGEMVGHPTGILFGRGVSRTRSDHPGGSRRHRVEQEPVRRRKVVVDKAYLMLRENPEASYLLWALIKRSRKRLCGLTIIPQDLADVMSTTLGESIINNASIHLLLRQTEKAIDGIGSAFGLSEGERSFLVAAETCPGLPAEVLMAIGQIESGHGANDGPSYAGAIGPMQFMPATWVGYGVDGNHDGFADPFDPADAIPSAAKLLCADGAGNPKTLMDAVELYNPGDPTYAVAVLEVAKGYAKEVATPTVTTPPTTSPTSP